jgi:hypothetical protein
MVSESKNFKGIYPILYAFFDRNGKLNREVMFVLQRPGHVRIPRLMVLPKGQEL